jgi:hypothetical protein
MYILSHLFCLYRHRLTSQLHLTTIIKTPFYLFNVPFNILPSMPMSAKWPLSPSSIPVCTSRHPIRVECTAHLNLLDLITQYDLRKSFNHEAPNYVIFSRSLSARPSQAPTPHSPPFPQCDRPRPTPHKLQYSTETSAVLKLQKRTKHDCTAQYSKSVPSVRHNVMPSPSENQNKILT